MQAIHNEAEMRALFANEAIMCERHEHEALQCPHMPDLDGIFGASDGLQLTRTSSCPSIMVTLYSKANDCDACSAALSCIVPNLASEIDAKWGRIGFSTNPFKQEAESSGKKRRHDEDYKWKLSRTLLHDRQTSVQNSVANADDVATTTWKNWGHGNLGDHRRATVRLLSAATGTFHVSEDGARLGRPGKEYVFYFIAHMRDAGKIGTVLPPQVVTPAQLANFIFVIPPSPPMNFWQAAGFQYFGVALRLVAVSAQ